MAERTIDTTPVHKRSWDQTLPPRSVLSDYDMRCIPYAITSYLHHVTGIPPCDAHHGGLCQMCGSAVRLVLQVAEPKIIEAAVKKMAASVGHGFIDLHPRGGDD